MKDTVVEEPRTNLHKSEYLDLKEEILKFSNSAPITIEILDRYAERQNLIRLEPWKDGIGYKIIVMSPKEYHLWQRRMESFDWWRSNEKAVEQVEATDEIKAEDIPF